jgi:isopentenyl diphosphate isomerase/L-lactate dehydrogenase-like FMN-dependent dehydrogenase
MGRPFLYSLTYGPEGVVHAIESESSMSVIASVLFSSRGIWELELGYGEGDDIVISYRSELIST